MEGRFDLPLGDAALRHFAGVITRLPPGALRVEDVTTEELRLFGTWDVACYYAPLDHVNPAARVVLVTPCPPLAQALAAHTAARDALWAGATHAEALRRAAVAAAPRGTFGSNLAFMLAGLGITSALGLADPRAMALSGGSVQMTYCIRYPLLVNDLDYTGRRPRLLRSPMLRPFLDDVFAPELASMPEAIVVPLGRIAGEAVADAIERGRVEPERCLLGVPNPSGANGHREDDYERGRDELAEQVRAWFARHPVDPGAWMTAG